MHLHEIETLLARHGYVFRRQTGHHRHYYRDNGQRITFSLPHGRQTHQLPHIMVQQLRARLAANECKKQRPAS